LSPAKKVSVEALIELIFLFKGPRWKRSLAEWLFGEWSVRKNSPTNSSVHVPSATPRPSMVEGAMSNHQQPLLVSIRPEQSPVMTPISKKCRGMSYGNAVRE
jgi:hypothetical protein